MVAMGADELAAAFHAPVATRSELSNIWNDALRDDDDDGDDPMQQDTCSTAVAVSPSSSSNTSNASSPSMPPHSQSQSQLLMPSGPGFFYSTASANANLNDLSAFLATSMAPSQPQATATVMASVNVVGTNHTSSTTASNLSGPTTSLSTNFLDDLLSSTDDMDFRVRGTATSTSAPSANNFMHMTSLPPSIQQTLHVQRQLAAAPTFGSLSDAPFLGMDSATGESSSSGALSSTTASRLLQLENNYERKKKRAKINRKDLNARFQELMDILNLKEDRKLNRAKVLEKTIEYIEKLEDELHAMRTRGDAISAAPSVTPTPPAFASAPVRPLPQSAPVMLANARSGHNISNGAPLMAFDPASAHAWSAAAAAAAGASSLSMAPMMWLPCPMVPPPPPSAAGSSSSGAALRPAPPAMRVQLSKRLGTRMTGPSSSTLVPADETSTDCAATDGSTRRSLKRARDSSCVSAMALSSSAIALSVPNARIVITSESLFVWGAHEIPTLLAFCDAWTLVRVMQTSKELAVVAKQNALWAALSRRRWRFSQTLEWPDAREQWTRLHREMHMPACGTVSSSGIRFASGRAQGVHVWGLLARRSNGRTTRTVLLGGKPTVMQVVELHVVLQNMGQRTVRLTDEISVRADVSSSSFAPFGLSSGAHLTPHVLSVNDSVCATKDLASVALHHGDVCVLGVFLQCPGLDLEQEFLQRASSLDVQCTVVAGSRARGAVEQVAVHAQCLDNARKKQLLDAHYSSLDEDM